ncbi:CPBP family intramembrane glutamic endopeptidase [Hymenobacter humi]|uniref:CPBP family intramembrane glutamic endopeptidase n=1 Tax=Hymenobacter humi TaxID=1411620 RepID=A0ABW2U9J2_9BACT
MAGILVQLLISWVLLRAFEKQDLSALGLAPTNARVKDFVIGLLMPVVYFTVLFSALSYLGHNPYHANPNYTSKEFFVGVWYLLKSVAFENLIFTGAILYILIKRLGTTKAALASAVAFGVYHWFSWNLFSQPTAMAVTFFTTGVAGFVWALAFAKTASVYLPFSLHFGVDFVFSILFSQDKSLGPQLLIKTYEADPTSPGTAVSILMMALYFLGFPVLTCLYLKTRKQKSGNTGLFPASE